MPTMLPSLKKPSEKAAVSLIPAWHPNFRNVELLPDIKVVRTSFFLNGAAILVVIGLVFYLIENTIALRALREQVAYWQHQIDTEKPGSDRAVAQFKKFQAEEKKLLELKVFQSAQVIGSEFLLQLGESLPPRVALSAIDYHGGSIVLRGNISGSSDEASGDAAAYVDVLGKFPAFAGKFDSVSLTGISRNTGTGGISFEILVKLKANQTVGKK